MHSNITIKEQLNIEKDLKVKTAEVENVLNVNTVDFDKYNVLPEHNNKNKLVCTDTSLYFYHNNTWNNILNNELFAFSHQQFIYNISNNQTKINLNKNLTVIELSELLTNNIYIELPSVNKNGADLTIVMGQSVNQYINDYNIIITGNF